MAPPVYQSPAAMSEVLGAAQRPEGIELLTQKMAPRPAPGMMNQGIPAARPIPVVDEGRIKEQDDRLAQELLGPGKHQPWHLNTRSWEMEFYDQPVPWHPEITFGEWITGVREEHGEEAAQLAIKKMQALQKENAEAQEPPETPPETPQIPPVPIMPTQPLPQQPGQQVQNQAPAQAAQPIMTAQEGGYVHRGTMAGELAPRGVMSVREAGETLRELRKRHEEERNYRGYADGGLVPKYALGGMNVPEEAQISEQDFMGILSSEAGNAGISEEALQTIAQNIPAAAQGAAANDNVMDSGIMETVEVEEAAPETDSGIAQLPALSEQLVAMGEEPLVQATPGEIIFDPRLLDEKQQRMLFASLEAAGVDPSTITVGGPMPINELTGLPAAGFGSFFKAIAKPFKAIAKGVKKVGKFLKKNAGTILGIAGALTGNPWLAALGSGVGSLIEGKPLKQALLSAGMSFVGTKWVGPWIGKQIGSALPTFGMSDVATGTALAKGVGGVPLNAAQTLSGQIAARTADATAKAAALKAGYGMALDQSFKGVAKDVAQRAIEKAMVDSIVPNAATAIAGAGSEIGAAEVASQALRTALPEVSSEALLSTAQNAIATTGGQLTEAGLSGLAAQGPGQVLTSQALGSVSNLLSQPVSQTLGGVASGALQYAAKPYVEAMFIPPEVDQDGLIEEFEAQYNYTPSSDELYQFYQGSFDPQPVNVAQTISTIPGYTGLGAGLPTLTAAGGGYIDGVGGPKTDSNLARLSDGEFVMTEKSVRGAGGGDRMKGAAKMYQMMNGLERRVA